jgi:cytochrome c oxidase cbb3-type subunit III
LLCAGFILAGAAWVAAIASGQEGQTGAQKGPPQQTFQGMTPEQRAAATRAFLGLGAVPDKAAAERGAPLFQHHCAFCHGKMARGATGPSLITSDIVLSDDHGERLTPFLKKGLPEKGMPSFATVPQRQLTDIAEFLHLQVENVANRGAYQVLNILVGDADKGKTYVESHCLSCHTAQALAHIAAKFRSPDQLQRNWIWPAHDANLTATVKTSDGTLAGRVTQLSDFRITLVDASGAAHTIDRGPNIEIQINDPLAAHQAFLRTLANSDMHNVTAYLETLK